MNAETITRRTWTDDELLALPDEKLWELRDGELRAVSPSGPLHAVISLRLQRALLDFVDRHDLGIVLESSGGFRLDKDNCFAADAAFISRERLNPDLDLDKFLPFAPDLAAEVLSPGNTVKQIERKFALYFAHGCRVAWFVFPKRRQVRVYRNPQSFDLLDESDILRGEPVLPGFAFPLKDLFKPLY